MTKLSNADNSKVALRSRQVLIAAHQPPYDLRYNQVESIFLSAIDMYGHEFCPENLQVCLSRDDGLAKWSAKLWIGNAFDFLKAFVVGKLRGQNPM